MDSYGDLEGKAVAGKPETVSNHLEVYDELNEGRTPTPRILHWELLINIRHPWQLMSHAGDLVPSFILFYFWLDLIGVR